MNGFFKRSKPTDLEDTLRRFRPRPSNDLVASIRGEPRSTRQRFARVGAALAAAGLVVVALGVGGAGYAYSSGSTSANKTSGIHLHQTGVISRPSSASDAQYGPVSVPPYPPSKSPPASPPPPSSSGGTSGAGGTSGGEGSSGGGSGSGQPSGTSNGTSSPPTVAGGGATHVTSSGNLPFTGKSLAFPLLLGAALIVLGLALRRKGRAKVQ